MFRPGTKGEEGRGCRRQWKQNRGDGGGGGGGCGGVRRCGGKIFWKAKRVEKREEAEMGEGGGEASTGNVCGLNAKQEAPSSQCVCECCSKQSSMVSR